MSRPTAQQMAIQFRKRDERIARIREAAKQELRSDELRDRHKGRYP